MVRIAYYLALFGTEFIDPRASPTVTDDGGSLIHVDGADGFGIPAMELAVEHLADAAPRHGLVAATVTRCGHTGRIGAYADALADHDLMALILGGGGHEIWPAVAPFGGAQGLLGTNPYAYAMPGGCHGNVVVDFATSATAQGKLAVARANGEPAPEGQIIDTAGRPSRNVEDFYDGGAILPAAGPKGYGMSLIAELVGFALLPQPLEFNWLVIAIDIARLQTRRRLRRRRGNVSRQTQGRAARARRSNKCHDPRRTGTTPQVRTRPNGRAAGRRHLVGHR